MTVSRGAVVKSIPGVRSVWNRSQYANSTFIATVHFKVTYMNHPGRGPARSTRLRLVFDRSIYGLFTIFVYEALIAGNFE